MAEFNKFSMYNLAYQGAGMSTKDEVDKMVDEIIDLHMYEDVKNFVAKNFGDVQGIQWFDYPELNKKVYVLNEAEKVEICMLKNNKQFYGKGWKHINNE